MVRHISLNDGWTFTPQVTDAFLQGEPTAEEQSVRLPHTCMETPYDYFDESIYQMVCGYRRTLEIPPAWTGQTLLLTFEGAAHYAEVFLNGEKLAEHRCGYTAFTVDLTGRVHAGGNLLAVRLDTRETLDQPPFGYVIDYMTYGGLYREVSLEVKERQYIADLFLKPQVDLETGKGVLRSDITLAGVEDPAGFTVHQTVTWTCEDRTVARGQAALTGGEMHLRLEAGQVELWDTESPAVYYVYTELRRNGQPVDLRTDCVGFRRAEFRPDGFYLNGKKKKLLGLNRHQSYPYVGYAMPESMQRQDADILKYELGLNAVRTSHYPQSRHFIDQCDRIGLLVFTEIPGWQHIGGDGWKAQAVENVREMITQYRNHPSIVLWGVRINESSDDDALYEETNAVAHALDPTRPTGGVRCIRKSNLLEDVYTYNDFIHDGRGRGCLPKRAVTPDMEKAYLISEHNGHMYPTKMFDSEYQLLEQALRHANVLDAVAGEADIAGSFGWCMFDYNTHRDFGSGDRICYHGVMDMYRNPKLAAAVYAAQGAETPVLEISSQMDIGEHPSGNMGKIYIITNADRVDMYKNGRLLRSYTPGDSQYKNLAHGPILITDYIGGQIAEEGFSDAQARLVRDLLNGYAVYGLAELPASLKARAVKAVTVYHMNFEDAYRLYGTYVGAWGGTAPVYRFEAVKDGQVVRVVEKTPAAWPQLRFDVSHTTLREGDTYDVAAIRIRITDQTEQGNLLRFYQGPVKLTVSGPLEIIGPETVTLRGGCGGTYVRTTGVPGRATLTLENEQTGAYTLVFEIETK